MSSMYNGSPSRYAIVLVTFNRIESLKKAIKKIALQTEQPAVLIVIDNNSSDGTDKYLDTLVLPFQCKIIKSDTNEGHGAALAKGMEYALTVTDIDYLLLLEDDSYPQSELAGAMLKLISNSKFSLICNNGFNIRVGSRYRPKFSGSSIVNVDFGLLDGAIIRVELLKVIGLPKRDFFMMCDDLEFSKRIRKYGYEIGCIKTQLHEVLHLGAGTTRSSIWRGYYQARNNIHILREYFSITELLDLILMESKRLFSCLLSSDRFYRIYLRLLGSLHGVMGRKGKTIDPINF